MAEAPQVMTRACWSTVLTLVCIGCDDAPGDRGRDGAVEDGVKYVASLAMHVDDVDSFGLDNARFALEDALDVMNQRFCVVSRPEMGDIACSVAIVLGERDAVFGLVDDGRDQYVTLAEVVARLDGTDGVGANATFIYHNGPIIAVGGFVAGVTRVGGGIRSILDFTQLREMPSTPHHEFGHQAGRGEQQRRDLCINGVSYMCQGRGTEEVVRQFDCDTLKQFRQRGIFDQNITQASTGYRCM